MNRKVHKTVSDDVLRRRHEADGLSEEDGMPKEDDDQEAEDDAARFERRFIRGLLEGYLQGPASAYHPRGVDVPKGSMDDATMPNRRFFLR